MYDFHEAFNHINWLAALKTFVQVTIICYMMIWVWRRIVGTQAERLVKGVLVLVGICALSYVFGFDLVTGFLQHLIPVAVMALLVIFQPEIRRGLGYLGKMNTFKLDLSLRNRDADEYKRDISQIINAVRELSRTKVGALIVVEPPEGERDYVSPGTSVNADISSTLLLTIFFPKSPLHDGAVVIRQNKIIAAGVILPMTGDTKLSYRYGTRHRAAIGLSAIYDGLCIVVSEETGEISAASSGMLRHYDTAHELTDPLTYIYSQSTAEETPSPVNAFLNLIGKGSSDRARTASGAEPLSSDVKTPSDSPAKADGKLAPPAELEGLLGQAAIVPVAAIEPEQAL